MMMVDLGYDTNDLLLVTVRTTGATTTRDANVALLDRIHDRFAHIAGVRSASYVRNAFLGAQRVQAGTQERLASAQIIGEGYLATLGLSLTAGRMLTLEDRDRAAPVAMMNENLADALWPGQPAVGRIMTLGRSRQPVEIVGVVRNAFVTGFNPERPNTRPYFVFVTDQPSLAPNGAGDPASLGDVTFYLRHDPTALDTVGAAIAPALRQIDPRVAIVAMRTMNAQLENVTLTARLIARLLAIFSIVSLLIAAIGQYAVIAFNMRRRVREFGVRIALGASGRQVVSSVLGEGLWLTAAGLLCGLGLSVGVALAVRDAVRCDPDGSANLRRCVRPARVRGPGRVLPAGSRCDTRRPGAGAAPGLNTGHWAHGGNGNGLYSVLPVFFSALAMAVTRCPNRRAACRSSSPEPSRAGATMKPAHAAAA
jgi:hypothetical protein